MGLFQKNTAYLFAILFANLPQNTDFEEKIKTAPLSFWLNEAVFYGVPGESRTRGLSLRRRTLYPTELRRQKYLINWQQLVLYDFFIFLSILLLLPAIHKYFHELFSLISKF